MANTLRIRVKRDGRYQWIDMPTELHAKNGDEVAIILEIAALTGEIKPTDQITYAALEMVPDAETEAK